MHTLRALSLCVIAALVLVPTSVPAQDDDEGAENKPKKRVIDTESPEALALADMLSVDPKYGLDKRVELFYTFGEPIQIDDFTHQGFDRVEAQYSLELGVGSQGQGLLLHSLHMKGKYEVELEARLEHFAKSSQLVFVFGDGKSGAIFGQVFSKRTSQGYKPLSKKSRADTTPYNGGRSVKLRYLVDGGEITAWMDGRELGTTKKLNKKLTGRVGVFCTNMRLVISSFSLKGEIDVSEL